MSFIETAYAMGAGQQGGQEGGLMSMLPMMLMIFGVFYFLLIRPEKKKADQRKKMIEALKKGDEVVTAGGFFGRIVDVDGEVMVVDLGESKVRTTRHYLSPAPVKNAVPPARKEGKKDRKGKKGAQNDAAEQSAAVTSEIPASETVVAEVQTAQAEPLVTDAAAPEAVTGAEAQAGDKDKPAV